VTRAKINAAPNSTVTTVVLRPGGRGSIFRLMVTIELVMLCNEFVKITV